MPLCPYNERFRESRKLIQQVLGTRQATQFHSLEERETVVFLSKLLDNPEKFLDHIRMLVVGLGLLLSMPQVKPPPPVVRQAAKSCKCRTDTDRRQTTMHSSESSISPWRTSGAQPCQVLFWWIFSHAVRGTFCSVRPPLTRTPHSQVPPVMDARRRI